MKATVHRHVLIHEDLGIKIVLLCGFSDFSWSEWATDCQYNRAIPLPVRQLGLLLLASGL